MMLIPFNCPSSSLDTWWPFCFGGLMLWLVGSACWLALVGRAPPASNELPPISSSSRLLPLSSSSLPFLSNSYSSLISFSLCCFFPLAHILYPSKKFDIRFIHPVGQPHVHLILQFCLFLFSLSFFSCRIRGKLDNFLRTNPINEPPSPRPD